MVSLAGFNEWRDKYDVLTDAEQSSFHSKCFVEHPVQAYFSHEYILKFMEAIRPELPGIHVLEAGGWIGEMAQHCMENIKGIISWVNFEICKEASARRIPFPHYVSYSPESFRWWRTWEGWEKYDAFVATHFIEHLSDADLTELLGKINTRYIYFEAPISPAGVEGWPNYNGSHILKMGWNKIIELLSPRYELMKGFDQRLEGQSVYAFERRRT